MNIMNNMILMNIMNIMITMNSMNIMNIMNITALMAMAGTISALVSSKMFKKNSKYFLSFSFSLTQTSNNVLNQGLFCHVKVIANPFS